MFKVYGALRGFDINPLVCIIIFINLRYFASSQIIQITCIGTGRNSMSSGETSTWQNGTRFSMNTRMMAVAAKFDQCIFKR